MRDQAFRAAGHDMSLSHAQRCAFLNRRLVGIDGSMGVSFAGSRGLDARRRRRLAVDQTALDAKPRARTKAKKLFINPIEELQKRVKTRPDTPIHSLIPSSVRRFTLLNFGMVTAWLLLLTVSLTQALWAPFVSPKLASFFEPQTGLIWPMWTGLMFLVTAQFSWLVYWYRRHSRRDFHGHYRIWLWTSLDWTLMGLGALTGLHQLVAETLIRLTQLPRDPYENLLWIAPLAGILVNLGHGLDREMASSKVGWRMFCLALSSAALVGMMLIGWRPIGNVLGDSIFMTVTSSFVPLALLIATLNQLYFVLYVTPESVRKQGGMLTAAGKRVTASTSKFFLSSLLTTGWMFRGVGRAYRLVMSLLFSLLLWKKLDVDVDTGKAKKPKPKAKPKVAVKEAAPAAATGRSKSRKAVVVEEPELEEEAAEEACEEEAVEEEAYEEEYLEEEPVEEKPAPKPIPAAKPAPVAVKPTPVKAAAAAKPPETKPVEPEPAAPKEEEWDQSAWEAEMKAFEESKQQANSHSNKGNNNSGSNQPSNSKNKKNQRFDQKHDSYSSPNQYEQNWQELEPEPEPAYSAPAQSSYDEQQWQNEDSGGEDYSDGLDPSDLRGMSKKDKRKMRKQMRDQQRDRD
jgi:hypothetical protein